MTRRVPKRSLLFRVFTFPAWVLLFPVFLIVVFVVKLKKIPNIDSWPNLLRKYFDNWWGGFEVVGGFEHVIVEFHIVDIIPQEQDPEEEVHWEKEGF